MRRPDDRQTTESAQDRDGWPRLVGHQGMILSWIVFERANLALTPEPGPVLPVEVHEFPGVLEGFGFGLHFHQRVTATDFLRYRERTVGDRDLVTAQLSAAPIVRRFQAGGIDERAGCHRR